MWSRPVWGAWIEIGRRGGIIWGPGSRAPYGARGLKSGIRANAGRIKPRRAPYGARGLKSRYRLYDGSGYQVAPRMGRVD